MKLVAQTKTTKTYRATTFALSKTQVVRKTNGVWKAELNGQIKGDRLDARDFWEHQQSSASMSAPVPRRASAAGTSAVPARRGSS